jgi:hypothetical protein
MKYGEIVFVGSGQLGVKRSLIEGMEAATFYRKTLPNGMDNPREDIDIPILSLVFKDDATRIELIEGMKESMPEDKYIHFV